MSTSMRNVPLAPYARIKQHIINHIESGDWAVNEQVPSENQLAAQFEVSRMTARRAILELTQDGMLVRSQGVGTFVAERRPVLPVLEVRNIADEISERGHRYGNRIITLEQLPATDGIAIALGITPGAPVYHSVILHLDNDVAVQLEDRYVNPKVAPHYLEQDFGLETPNAYLSRVAPLSAVEHTIEAILPSPEVSAWLGLAAPEACLQMLRRTWALSQIATFARLIHPGNSYRLSGYATVAHRASAGASAKHPLSETRA